MRPLLDCSSLAISAGRRRLVDGLTLALAAGDLVALLGPNGVGKTLSLHTLAGLRSPSAGSIRLLGEELAGLSRRRIARTLGLLLQDDADPFPSTVLAAALMGRHPHIGALAHESPEDIAMAREALATVGLQDREAQAVATLSGGERRRLSLARVLAQDPQVLLLDEPVNHLDPRHQVAVLEQCARLASAGRAVLMTLHDPSLAARFAHKALLLFDDGSWDFGDTESMLSPTNLSRLFGTAYEVFSNEAGVSVPLPCANSRLEPGHRRRRSAFA